MPTLEPYDSESVLVDDLKNQLQDVAKAKGMVNMPLVLSEPTGQKLQDTWIMTSFCTNSLLLNISSENNLVELVICECSDPSDQSA